MDIREFILQQTVLASPTLCPEIKMRLITESCPLWHAQENELERLQIPEPYWAFAWPGGQALARHLLDHPERVRGKRVLDFGAGGGIVAIAACKAGAASVAAADVDATALVAIELNAQLNQVAVGTISENLLLVSSTDWDVVLAGDVCYDGPLTEEVLNWTRGLANQGIEVLIADPSRGYLAAGSLLPLASYRSPADVDPGGKYFCQVTIFQVQR